jgi:hypothetical protein
MMNGHGLCTVELSNREAAGKTEPGRRGGSYENADFSPLCPTTNISWRQPNNSIYDCAARIYKPLISLP